MRRDMANRAGHLVRLLDVPMRDFQAVQAQEACQRHEEEQSSHFFILLRIQFEVKGWMESALECIIAFQEMLMDYAFDAVDSDFDEKVLKSHVPVVVDFWAPWCAPCRMLKPVLEKLASEYAGKFLLARVNADENPVLARRYNVRGIPDVRLFVKGEIAEGFTGALPESSLRAFLDRTIPSPSETLRLEAAGLEPDAARTRLLEALMLDPENQMAKLDLAGILLDLNEMEEAKRLIGSIHPDVPRAEQIRSRLAFLESGNIDESQLLKIIEAAPGNLDARMKLAAYHASKKQYEGALEQLLEVVRLDNKHEKARKTMLAIFDLASSRPDLVSRYRKLLASALH